LKSRGIHNISLKVVVKGLSRRTHSFVSMSRYFLPSRWFLFYLTTQRNITEESNLPTTVKTAILTSYPTSVVNLTQVRSRDSAVSIASGYGLDDRGIGVRVPVMSRIFSSPRSPAGSGAYPASYPMSTGGSFLRGKAAEA
jgi:hypothetical protein